MTDVVFSLCVRKAITGVINFDSDTFYAMLVTATYTPNKDAHDFRDDVTNEISGAGYTAGGKEIPVTVEALDTATDYIDVTFGPVDWTGLTASDIRQAVIYKRRGGASSADELIYCHDFDADTDIVAGTLEIEATTLRFDVSAA